MGRIAIFGATSGIARAVSEEFMRHGRDLILIGRDEASLKTEAADLAVRHGRESPVFTWDLLKRETHRSRFAELTALADLEGVFFAAGVMSPEGLAEMPEENTRLIFDLNLTETVVVLNLFSGHFRRQGSGFISALSSVAGDRGRGSIRTYAASKAGLTAYLEGLRGSLQGTGVLVQTVKPGPVRTPMTADYKGPKVLLARPEPVAKNIVHGLEKHRTTIYAPGYWRAAMALIRHLPEFLMRRIPG